MKNKSSIEYLAFKLYDKRQRGKRSETETAEADLAEIWSYVAAEASELTATRLIDRIMQACEQPRYFPLAAPARDYLAFGMRVTFTGNYAVYYQHDEQHLTIIRVLHGARDIDALAGHGGFSGA